MKPESQLFSHNASNSIVLLHFTNAYCIARALKATVSDCGAMAPKPAAAEGSTSLVVASVASAGAAAGGGGTSAVRSASGGAGAGGGAGDSRSALESVSRRQASFIRTIDRAMRDFTERLDAPCTYRYEHCPRARAHSHAHAHALCVLQFVSFELHSSIHIFLMPCEYLFFTSLFLRLKGYERYPDTLHYIQYKLTVYIFDYILLVMF